MSAVEDAVARKVRTLQSRAATRDVHMLNIRRVREGDIAALAPDLFPEEWPRSVVANFIDVAAQDTSEMLAPLPTLDCASGAMKTDTDKARAAKKNKVGTNYWTQSRLSVNMFWGADQFISYGFLPFYVEPDFERNTPIIHAEDPTGAYYENDRFGRTRLYVKVWKDSAGCLAAQFPEHASQLLKTDFEGMKRNANEEAELEVVRYCDDDWTILYCPTRDNTVLARYRNPSGRCPAAVAEWPTLCRNVIRGRFDDLIWVQIARSVMAVLAIQAGWESVNAPIQVPRDVNNLPVGPNAIIRTDGRVGRVPLEIPQSAFAIEATLDSELQRGARYPGARSGDLHASIITGRGVQELLGSFDSQIRKAQTILGEALREATSLAFEIDEKVFGSSPKTINGTMNGETYQITYSPTKDIAGNYVCEVTYGFASGLSPQNSVVMLLQLRGDRLISRDTVRRQMPWPIDADHEQRTIDIQEANDALMQGIAAYAQALGPAIQAGQDPNQLLGLIAEVIKGRQDGRPLADVVSDYYKRQAEEAQQAAEQQAAGQEQPGLPGVNPNGLLAGVAPGQAGQPPGGLPDIQTLIAGLRGGRPVLDASVSRRIPA